MKSHGTCRNRQASLQALAFGRLLEGDSQSVVIVAVGRGAV